MLAAAKLDRHVRERCKGGGAQVHQGMEAAGLVAANVEAIAAVQQCKNLTRDLMARVQERSGEGLTAAVFQRSTKLLVIIAAIAICTHIVPCAGSVQVPARVHLDGRTSRHARQLVYSTSS